MQNAITRLALLQFLAVFYCILAIGVILKVRFGSPAPEIFATHLRDYGFFLLLLPAAWLIWASLSTHRPLAGAGDLPPIIVSGIVLLGFLIFLALLGTGSAMSRSGLIPSVPTSPPSVTDPP